MMEILWEEESFQFGFKRWQGWAVSKVLWEWILYRTVTNALSCLLTWLGSESTTPLSFPTEYQWRRHILPIPSLRLPTDTPNTLSVLTERGVECGSVYMRCKHWPCPVGTVPVVWPWVRQCSPWEYRHGGGIKLSYSCPLVTIVVSLRY